MRGVPIAPSGSARSERFLMKRPAVLKMIICGGRGSSAVEFALLLPIFSLIIFGIFEFGSTYRDYLAITHAAREGARLAAVGDYSEAEVAKRAYPVSPTSISISYLTPDGAPQHGFPAEVAVEYDRPLVIPMFMNARIHLISKAQMRVEY